MLAIAMLVVLLLVLAALVLLIIGVVKPALLWRVMPFLGKSAPSRKRALLVFAPALVVLLVAEVVLTAQPNYEVSLPSGDKVVAGESAGIKLAIENSGTSAGTYAAEYALDGVRQGELTVPVAGSGVAGVVAPLPDDLEPGKHTIMVGETSFAITALRPAAFTVSDLASDTELALTGQRVAVTATVTNTGEVAGDFDESLYADGDDCAMQLVTVAPGEAKALSYEYKSSRQGKHQLRLGDAKCTQIVVKPVRYANGHFLRRTSSGGRGVLQVKNGNRTDGVVVLARQSARKTPVIACYIRGRQSFAITGIPDGKYWIYYTLGRSWNTLTNGFVIVKESARFETPARFTTSTSTTSWSDSSYRYTQSNTRYSKWKITLHAVEGGTGHTVSVDQGDFPGAR